MKELKKRKSSLLYRAIKTGLSTLLQAVNSLAAGPPSTRDTHSAACGSTHNGCLTQSRKKKKQLPRGEAA